MRNRFAAVALALLMVAGCAGPSKLAERSEQQLAGGENQRAWELATHALNRDPGNVRARAAASAAGNAIARDWEQRIAGLAPSDSVAAAEQVLELTTFRVDASRYAVITVTPEWSATERALKMSAAHMHYQQGVADLATARPKRAYLHFMDSQRFVPGYRDVAKLSDRAYAKAVTRVAFVPFATASDNPALGRDVAGVWRDQIAEHFGPTTAHFTRVLGSAAIEQQMNVSQLGRLSREDAIALARKAGAERVVWGSVGAIQAQTKPHLFADVIARRVTEKNAAGDQVTRWVDVPVEVISRVRTVTVDVDYEIIATKDGSTLSHRRGQRTNTARVVWTSFDPEGDLGSYALISDTGRASHPDRARDLESRWQDVCGASTTVQQVFEARRAAHDAGHYDRDALPRFMAGAAFVFLQELPPAEDLAFAALSAGWQPLQIDLQKLDDVDDIDLGMAVVRDDAR
jgi:hypothetical protein